MSIEQAIELIRSKYEENKEHEGIKDPVAYTLYQVWKIADSKRTDVLSVKSSTRIAVLPVGIGDSMYWAYPFGPDGIDTGKVSGVMQKSDGSWKIRISNRGSSFFIEEEEIGNGYYLSKDEVPTRTK